MKLLRNLIIGWADYKVTKRENKLAENMPDNNYSGKWVNKGNYKNENWVWVEKSTPKVPYYVSVVKTGSKHYTIIVDENPVEFAIESGLCEDVEEVDLTVSMLVAGYSTQGTVVVDSCLTEKGSD